MALTIVAGNITAAQASKNALEQQIKAAQRLLACQEARDDILKFTKLTMPSVQHPNDVTQSRYEEAQHHKVLAAALEAVAEGKILRLIVTMPPRHGKSELVSRRFPAWYMGKDPYKSIIFATYNEEFSEDFGRDVREIMRQPVYTQIFPHFEFRQGAVSAGRIQTKEGGLAVFVGRGGSITGRGANILLIDDLIKDAEEADSAAAREKAWEWFTSVAMTRLMDDSAGVVIVMTRWHEDDVVGRLTDPSNKNYDKIEAKKWKIINLPFFAEENDPMGRPIGGLLWPERFSKDFGDQMRRMNPRKFGALYQQHPAPEDGDLFRRANLLFYRENERPNKSDLRIYAVSDHAVGVKQKNDLNCFIIFGVDSNDNVWILDIYWQKAGPEQSVQAMMNLMKMWKPMTWFAESGHITKSIGPFLRKRMLEEKIYVTVQEVTPVNDKVQRAQGIIGRFSMKKIWMPKVGWWVDKAVEEMMKFPYATHDDFVDAMSLMGLVMDQLFGASIARVVENKGPRTGTIAWIKAASDAERKQQKLEQSGL